MSVEFGFQPSFRYETVFRCRRFQPEVQLQAGSNERGERNGRGINEREVYIACCVFVLYFIFPRRGERFMSSIELILTRVEPPPGTGQSFQTNQEPRKGLEKADFPAWRTYFATRQIIGSQEFNLEPTHGSRRGRRRKCRKCRNVG